ncbi:MAG: hypothetical protein P0111_03980 [Nitrospira sp.]|nr:hypothetical protein [Nitrospira sp.]
MEPSNGIEAITGKLIRARRLRMQKALQLFVYSGVIRLAASEPPHLRIEAAVPPEPADHTHSTPSP